MKYAYQQSSGESRSMTFKADSGPLDKPSGGGDFAVRTSEVLAGDDRTLPDQLREAEEQRDEALTTLRDPQKWLRWCDIRVLEQYEAERERAEAAERKVDELERACARLNDVTWEWADWQQKAKAEVDEYRQALRRFEGDGPTIINGEMTRHFAGCDGYACRKVQPTGDAYRCKRARDALREEQPQGGVRPREGGKYSLFCYDCGEWVPDTANNEMRKEGYFAHSHICAVGEPETQE